MSTTSTRTSLKILVVVAHPHDFTHMAGTCGKHVQRGDSVTVVSATGGARIHNEPLERELRKPKEQQDPAIVNESTEAYGQRKRHELIAACALFGITDVRLLPYPDIFLEPSKELDHSLAEVIREIRPDLLLTHAPFATPQRGHFSIGTDDHRTTGMAVQRACSLACMPDARTGQLPHRIAKTFYMGPEWSFNDWDVIVDITDQVTRRVEAEKLFKSQGHTPDFALKRIEVVSGSGGVFGGFAYGEVFLVARATLTDHLPVTDIELEHAGRSGTDHIAAISTRLEDLMRAPTARR